MALHSQTRERTQSGQLMRSRKDSRPAVLAHNRQTSLTKPSSPSPPRESGEEGPGEGVERRNGRFVALLERRVETPLGVPMDSWASKMIGRLSYGRGQRPRIQRVRCNTLGNVQNPDNFFTN